MPLQSLKKLASAIAPKAVLAAQFRGFAMAGARSIESNERHLDAGDDNAGAGQQAEPDQQSF
jgi:hypothetical protein